MSDSAAGTEKMAVFLSTNRDALFDCYRQCEGAALRSLQTLSQEHFKKFLDCLIALFGQGLQASAGEPHEEQLLTIESDGNELGETLSIACVDPALIPRHFGDICELITAEAMRLGVEFEVFDYQVLNKCLDAGIAGAITGFKFSFLGGQADSLQEKHNSLMHELRNFLSAAHLSLTLVKSGKVGLEGATGRVLERSIDSMIALVQRELLQVKGAGCAPALNKSSFTIDSFVKELVQTVTMMYGQDRLRIRTDFPAEAEFLGDKQLLLAALFNLLQNAFKFTKPGTTVQLAVEVAGQTLRLSVADHCGGIPPDAVKRIFESYVQSARDTSGVGLGLTVARKTIDAHDGVLRVENHPGYGCVFIAELPFVMP